MSFEYVFEKKWYHRCMPIQLHVGQNQRHRVVEDVEESQGTLLEC